MRIVTRKNTLLLALFATSLGCTTDPVTQIVVGVSTQVDVPRDVRALRATIQQSGENLFCSVYTVENGAVTLPQTLGLLSERDPKLPVTVSWTALMYTEDDPVEVPELVNTCVDAEIREDHQVRLIRKSVQQYVEDKKIYLPMPLNYSCYDTVCSNPDDTCIGGLCQSAEIDASTLPEYTDELAIGNTNTCFNLADCFPKDGTLTPQVVDAETCTYELAFPEGMPDALTSGSGLNIRVWYEGGLVSEVLDNSEKDGYFIPDPSKPRVFQLAEGLCQSIHEGGCETDCSKHPIVAIAASGVCPSKTVFQPICQDQTFADIDSVVAPIEPLPENSGGYCFSRELTPAPSALLVLMDRSASMDFAFEPEGLQTLMGISFGDPVFEQTHVGLQFFPPTENESWECEDPTPSEPSVSFQQIQGQEQTFVDAFAVGTMSENPVLKMDVWLSWAYQQLLAYKAANSTGESGVFDVTNRLAVAVIGNRDFTSYCSESSMAELAELALGDSEIKTYVVVLPSSDETITPDTATANGIASSGGTTEAFDATDSENPASATDALNTLTSDLSSCVYRLPSSSAGEALSPEVVLSYLNPITKQRVLLESAGEATSVGDDACIGKEGWISSDTEVRICGQACTDLREVLKERSIVAALTSTPLLDVPIVATFPCR